MAGMNAEATIARSVPEVFRFFLDLEDSAPKTDPSVSVVKKPEGPTGPGTTFHLRQHGLGMQRETTTRFTAVQPNASIDFEARIGPMRPTCSLTFQQADEGTRVTFAGDSNPIGPMRPFSALLDRKGQQVWTERLTRIKTVLETEAP